jgi:transposase-like protein
MDPQQVFCHNLACPASGQVGKGNITIHSQKEQLYKCSVCGQTFSARKGTIFHRRHTPEETISQVLTLAAHG